MPVSIIPFWQTWIFVYLLAPALLVVLLVFARQLRRALTQPTPRATTATVTLAVGIAVLSSVIGYGFLVSYEIENTWYFSFSVTLEGVPQGDSVVVPSVADTALLRGFAVSAGAANWSFVDTVHGRGLFIAFVGNASLAVFVNRYPPPNPTPDTSLTMVNGTAAWSPVWIFHPRSTPLSLSLCETYLCTGIVEIQPGWEVYPMTPIP